MRLNLGAGDHHLPGWVSVDMRQSDVILDLRFPPYSWQDNSIDEILASHIIEHFDKTETYRFLRECYRILKPNCVLHIATPDLDKFIAAKVNDNAAHLGDYAWQDLNFLAGGDESETRPGFRHRQIYCCESLAFMLNVCRFRPLARNGPEAFDNDEYAAISLYMDGTK